LTEKKSLTYEKTMQQISTINIFAPIQTKTKKEIIQPYKASAQYNGRSIVKQRQIIPAFAPSLRIPRFHSLKPKTYLEILEQSGSMLDEKSLARIKTGIFDLWQCIIFSEKGFTMPWIDASAPLSTCIQALLESFEKIKHPESQYEISQEYNTSSLLTP